MIIRQQKKWKHKLIKSPIKYFGGKGTMVSRLLELCPNPVLSYVEPFCGSAVMGLQFGFQGIPIVLNDIDLNLYNFYRVLSDSDAYMELIRRLDSFMYHEEARRDALEALKQPFSRESVPDVDRAYHYFVLNRTSRGGHGGFSVNLLKRRDTSKSIADFEHGVETLYQVHPILKKSAILSTDGISLLGRFDHQNAFIYCDPPYHLDTRTETRYNEDMRKEDHVRFVEALLQVKNAQVMVSGYDHPLYDRLIEAGWNKSRFGVKTVDGQNRSKDKIETVWRNYVNGE